MNVLQINTTDIRGGAAKVAYSLKEELEKSGYKAPMFVGRKYSNEPNIKLLNNTQSFSGKARKKLAYWLANDIDVFSSDHLLRTREFLDADIVHCHNLHSYYFNLATLKKISAQKPVIWTFHDMWPITAHCAHSFDGKLQANGFFACPSLKIFPPIAWHNEKYLEARKKNIYNSAKFHIVTVSRWLKEKVEKSLLGNRPLSVIYNGIDTSVFRPYSKDESRRKLKLPFKKKIILSVIKRGQSNPWKGADYVAEAIKRFGHKDNIVFILLGGDSNERDEKIINIPYTKDQTELAKYYSSADILLYPSIADTFGLVVAEAQACGLPVVAFETGGIPEIVWHQRTGYIAKYKNSDDLVRGIDWLLGFEGYKQKEMSADSIARITHEFSLDKMISSYIELYRQLADK